MESKDEHARLALCDVRGLLKDLMDKLCGEGWQKWLEATKLFLRGKPTWAEEMMFKPIEWGVRVGFTSPQDLHNFMQRHNVSLHISRQWRLPTITELERGLESGEKGFEEGVYYYSCTPDDRPQCGNEVMEMRCGHVCSSSSKSVISMRDKLQVRLCRNKLLN